MSLNPLAPDFFPHCRSCTEPSISLCNSTTMSLPLAQLLCGMPPQTIPSHAPSINQHTTEGTFLLPFLQPTNQSKPDAAAYQPTPGSSALLSSSLQHQANCLKAIHKNHPTVWPTLEGRKSRQTDVTTHCPSTAKWLCLIALLALLPGWNNLQQRYCR